jgi:tRNA threonylcarbamoyladenosine biosynthesis protein TsaE
VNDPRECSRRLDDEEATMALGRDLACGIAPGLQLHLHGDLGAGKTTLVRGLLRALGFEGRVKSPTFTLVEPYELSKLSLYHFDFYRFETPEELRSAGLLEFFGTSAVCIVEWPEKAQAHLPAPDLEIWLRATDDGGRAARLIADTERGERWLNALPT